MREGFYEIKYGWDWGIERFSLLLLIEIGNIIFKRFYWYCRCDILFILEILK